MHIQVIITNHSVWIIDHRANEFLRAPKVSADGAIVQYTGQWEPFVSFVETADGDDVSFTIYLLDSSWIRSSYRISEQQHAYRS